MLGDKYFLYEDCFCSAELPKNLVNLTFNLKYIYIAVVVKNHIMW